MDQQLSVVETARTRASTGMEIAAVAALDPERRAIVSTHGNRSFKELNERANRIANLLRSQGYREGDGIALLCGNRPEFIEVRFAAHRIGARLTTVNWHLSPEEAAYIIEDCDAVALFADVRSAQAARRAVAQAGKLKVKLAIGGDIEGLDNYELALADYPATDISDATLGNLMQYTSGTTGRPKGVMRRQPDPEAAAGMQEVLTMVFQFEPESGRDAALITGPLYHAGPFNLAMNTPLTAGIGVVMMDKWEPERTLQLIEQHNITHVFMVPTMFMRLLALPESVRSRYDISSLRFVIHGAAPCSVETKQAMLDWFGPIIWEIFAGTEGPGTIVSPQQWLAKPGTVGKASPGQLKICGADGNEMDFGVEGEIWWHNPEGSRFEYYKRPGKTKSPEKTATAQAGEYFTVGDIGYLDKDGYLFITGRSAECIISGGVNIYPQEIDDALLTCPKVADVACVGVPHPDLREAVKAVVQLVEGETPSAELEQELIGYLADKLAKQKWPRSIDFVDEIPRSPAGKVYRCQLRDSYWQDEATKI